MRTTTLATSANYDRARTTNRADAKSVEWAFTAQEATTGLRACEEKAHLENTTKYPARAEMVWATRDACKSDAEDGNADDHDSHDENKHDDHVNDDIDRCGGGYRCRR